MGNINKAHIKYKYIFSQHKTLCALIYGCKVAVGAGEVDYHPQKIYVFRIHSVWYGRLYTKRKCVPIHEFLCGYVIY